MLTVKYDKTPEGIEKFLRDNKVSSATSCKVRKIAEHLGLEKFQTAPFSDLLAAYRAVAPGSSVDLGKATKGAFAMANAFLRGNTEEQVVERNNRRDLESELRPKLECEIRSGFLAERYNLKVLADAIAWLQVADPDGTFGEIRSAYDKFAKKGAQ